MIARRTLIPMLTWTCVAFALLGLLAVLPAPGGEPRDVADARRPIVIAHRGASGYLPELTLPAFTLAHAQGSDLIETDVLLTKDGHLINLHDLSLERTTNVEQIFPNRARENGKFYAADFTLEEIRRLAIDGPTDRFDGQINSGTRIPTFEELIELVQHLNRTTAPTTGQEVGLLVEVKDPAFHVAEGLPIEKAVLETLERYGIDEPSDGWVVQSFDAAYLRRLRQEYGTKLPLVWLFGEKPESLDLAEVAGWANGIGPSRGRIAKETDLVQRAHDLGLSVYSWTFNDDPALSREYLVDHGIDGIITDYPDVAVKVRAENSPQRH